MIHEVQELDGTLSGKVICGNPACRRVLRTYEGSENAPGPSEARYILFKAQKRLLFVGQDGSPVSSLPRWRANDLGADLKLTLAGRVVGYQLVPGSSPQLEDFCSDRCAVEYLSRSPQWSLCFRRRTDNILIFVAQAGDRFSTHEIVVP